MDNVKINKLWFNRSYVTFDNFFPVDIVTEIEKEIKSNIWHDHGTQAHRQTLNTHNIKIHAYLCNTVPNIIHTWCNERVVLKDWGFWRDREHLYYDIHTDWGMFKTHEYHLQVYLNNMDQNLGTCIHSWLTRQCIDRAVYKANSGIFLNTAQTILHSVNKVLQNQERISIQARYVNLAHV